MAFVLQFKELAGWGCNLNACYPRHSHLSHHHAGRSDSALEERALGRESCAACPVAGSVLGSGLSFRIAGRAAWGCNARLVRKCPLSFVGSFSSWLC